MRFTITGDNLQLVNVQLEETEVFQSVAGSMAYMTGNMVMEAKKQGGILKGLGRSKGAPFPLAEYRSKGGTGVVGLGGSVPGKIVDLDIGKGRWMVHSTGYLGSQTTVELNTEYRKKLGDVVFGEGGLVILELSGTGIAFAAACGDFITADLKPKEQYKVAAAKALAWQDTVEYDIAAVPGIKPPSYGGDGFFTVTLTGPGKIVIQSMSLSELALSVAPFIPAGR